MVKRLKIQYFTQVVKRRKKST